ncbi:tautomerase [Coleophoma cylindrospora]|uniref:L-dopachrome isomerase n=1 Tax=Coleophoma cylindrospora TaxID=1849047 RepID=A0A3D8SF14_9HELO|nr:tautomerase [Coleophoma cylindrospora]
MPNSVHSAEPGDFPQEPSSPATTVSTQDQRSQSISSVAGKTPAATSRKQKTLSQFALPPSPAESMLLETSQHPIPTTKSVVFEENKIMRDIDRGAPGDAAIFTENKTPEQKDYARRKSQHYSAAFTFREPNSSARERISRESIVMADVRTNVIIQDEYTFITDLSYNLSSRYQRPESSILVTVTHSACLLFGGSFDPAYTMTITALPSQVQQVTNKRNAALLQKNMEEALGVAPDRGLIKFVAIAEENLATNGKTAAAEIEDLEMADGVVNGGGVGGGRKASVAQHRKGSISAAAKANKRKSTKSMQNMKIGTGLPTHDEAITPPLSGGRDSPPSMPRLPDDEETSPLDRKAERVQKMGKRKSFLNVIRGRA